MLRVFDSAHGEEVFLTRNRDGPTVSGEPHRRGAEEGGQERGQERRSVHDHKVLENLASRVPGQEETVKNLETFRLKMILR